MRAGMKYREYIDEVTRAIKKSELSQSDFVIQFKEALVQEIGNVGKLE